jgi:hypothetical protein
VRKASIAPLVALALIFQLTNNSSISASTEAPPVVESVNLVTKSNSYAPGDILTLEAVISGGDPEVTSIAFYPTNKWGLGIGNIVYNKGMSTGEWLPEFQSVSSTRVSGQLKTTFRFSMTVQQQTEPGTYQIGRNIRAQDATGLAVISENLPTVTILNSKILAPGVLKPSKNYEQISLDFLTSAKDFGTPIKLPRISDKGSPIWWIKTGGPGCELRGARFAYEYPDTVVFRDSGGACSLNVRTIGDDYFAPFTANVTLNVPKKNDSSSPISKSPSPANMFKNCTELNKVYPGGVALPGAVNAGGMTKITPKIDKKLYEANKKSDRDKDGIACEK